MNKIANVVFAYSPTNDDELELTVGDKIEVIGYEEEGWWKGRLKGRVGVFPSNFVQVIEQTTTGGPTQQQQQQQATPNSNKLNSLFGSLVNTKNTISSNSLNNITSNSNNNLNINNNNNSSNNNNNNSINSHSTSSNNLIMNNTHQQQQPQENLPSGELSLHTSSGADESLHSASSFSERRPKPLRGMGYGDIFVAGAKTKPLPADPMASSKITTAMASERPSTNSLASTLQKPIPKKPPPPAPAVETNVASTTNGSSSDQAPALPPKPGSNTGFSPFLQQRPLPSQTTQQRANREQVRVIYAYTPTNSDELVMRVGDIIDVIDKNIEDPGWWRGELNGKIGVFPDNFVEVINPQEGHVAAQDWQNSSRLSGSAASNLSNSSTSHSGGFAQQQQSASSTDGRIKSVFAGTPKGFSKELESNLEKHNNPASFLSLKRNKLQQQVSSSGLPSDTSAPASIASNLESAVASSLAGPNSITASLRSDFSETQNGHTINMSSPLETSPGKLNHITANRAKGPARRPPTNILNKRNQLNELASSNHNKRNSIELKDDQTPLTASLPAFNQAQAPIVGAIDTPTTTINKPSAQINIPETLSSLPSAEQQKQAQLSQVKSEATSLTASPFTSPLASEQVSPSNNVSKVQSSSSSNNVPDGNQVALTPKTNQRAINQSPVIGQQQETKSKLTSSGSTSSTPPWMVELRKTNAEKKRDPATASVTSMEDIITAATAPAPVSATIVATPPTPVAATTVTTTPTTPAAPIASATTASQLPAASANCTNELVTAKYESILKQISKEVHTEINELKSEVKKLREDFKCIDELKNSLETMKVELKTCQSATESQRRYIKDLVNNLADERKRIAAMQVEIDRNLK